MTIEDPEAPEARIAAVTARSPVMAVTTLRDAAHAVPVAAALLRGGVCVLEITLRTPAGLEAVRRVAAEAPGVLVGAGTCLAPKDLERAKAAGAAFAVSPGLSRELMRAAAELELPYLPGVATASEVMLAMEWGRRTLKMFPAGPAGGPALLRALHGPFPSVRFCPTGGVTAADAGDYLALPNVACVGGSWLTPAAALEAADWTRVTQAARESVLAARRARAADGGVPPA